MSETPSASVGRRHLLQDVADRILALRRDRVIRVGIDGVDGAGKTVFADELAPLIVAGGRLPIRVSVDDFHHPRARRYRLGHQSPEGFFLDSYDYAGMRRWLLDPLSPGGSGRYRRALFDHVSDTPVDVPEACGSAPAVLLVDGIFLHRPELRDYWDFSLFLAVGFEVSIPRGAQRGTGSPDPHAAENRRYVEGQRLYLQQCQPQRSATLTIDNNDLAAPCIVLDRPKPI